MSVDAKGMRDAIRHRRSQTVATRLKLRELEAESVAFLVAKRNGVESKSETYLAEYVRFHKTVDDLDFYQMTRAAGLIETLLGVAAHTRFDPPDRVEPPTQMDLLLRSGG